MKKFSLALFTAILVLGGCGKQEPDSGNKGKEEQVPAIIEADLKVPEKADANKEVTLSVKVSQNEKNVDDADVKFEIWKDGQKDQSEMIQALLKDGVYSIDHQFKEDGLYHVQSHVAARSMHTMPKATIQVGDKTAAESHHEEHGEGEADHHGNVAIAFEHPDHIHAKEKASLSVELEKDQSPLKEARVRLEIEAPNESNPSWIEMKENQDGHYNGDYTFASKGDYKIHIHVENDEGLHEHTTKTVTVE